MPNTGMSVEVAVIIEQNMPVRDRLHFVYPERPSSNTTVILDVKRQKAVQCVPASVVYICCQLMFAPRFAARE